jgi:DNA-binding winged helix-turn-helix (wHTH) protein
MLTDIKHFESLYPPEARERELAEIVRYIKEGNSSQIVSIPGVGCSNLLGLLAYNKQIREKHFPTKNTYVHFVMVNFSELQGRPLIDVTKLMFLNLVSSLRERDMQEEHAVINEIFRESLELRDEFVIFQGLKRAVEYLSVEKKLTLIFLFDRFEEYVPLLTHAFFSNLRILRNLAKYRFSVVFSLNKPLEDLLEPVLMEDFYEFVAGHTVYLSIYDEPSVTFRITYIEQLLGRKLPEDVYETIRQLSGGHWKLMRLGAEAVLGREHEGALSDFLLIQKSIRGALDEILRSLSPVEQKSLLQGKESWEQDEAVREYFTQVGLVNEQGITIPLLETYLQEEKQSLTSESGKIVFDTEKNVIRKGETILSDDLTAAEFRLLAYLLNHSDRVIDREEVISVVWQDAKTTAGVTDQAVDQLIFRLRRKIEENPNQPRHLLTVKGRGFSFTP